MHDVLTITLPTVLVVVASALVSHQDLKKVRANMNRRFDALHSDLRRPFPSPK